MRIIGGALKGIKIFEANDKNTRPLKDLVKESLLNILQYSKNSNINLNNSLVLDLFSGTGSFGLECISRGASKVFFFENYYKSLQILNKNIKKLKCENKALVIDDDAFNFYKNNNLKKQKLDLIFLDPPYKQGDIKILLNNIVKTKLLKETGIVVLHRHKKQDDDLGSDFIIKRSENYGISKIVFLKLF